MTSFNRINSAQTTPVNDEDFAAFLESELEHQEEDATAAVRLKKTKALSTAAAMQQQDLKVKLAACSHPGYFKHLCILCGQSREDVQSSAVVMPLGYIHKDLYVALEEMARVRTSHLRYLMDNKKLCLVLDLDHTLLNSIKFEHIFPDEKEYLENNFLQNTASLFKLESMKMVTKLRPFVRTFLKEASTMYDMYVYTMGQRDYALQMAELLDPGHVYFNSKVISQLDSTEKGQKGLDVLLGAENVTVILDDTQAVWSRHQDNLIVMERYHFFASSARHFGIRDHKSHSQSRSDESGSHGALESILQVLKSVHHKFFLQRNGLDAGADVRQVLKTVRKEVLKDCKIVFSGIWPTKERAVNQRIWHMAGELGASCSTKFDSSISHVVAANALTAKALQATQLKKFLVCPGWIEATYSLWKRMPEGEFPVEIQTK